MSYTGEPLMKPEGISQTVLAITRAKGKMYEYFVQENYHIEIPSDPARLFYLSIGILGDLAAAYSRREELSESLQHNIIFSSYFFDAYIQSRLDNSIDPYIKLLGATSYYLSGLPGSSSVLANQLDCLEVNFDCDGLENLLTWLLQNNFEDDLVVESERLGSFIKNICENMSHYASTGEGDEKLFDECSKLRKTIYLNGSPRQLLLVDAIYSIVRKKHENSTWYSLPKYTNLQKDQWSVVLKKRGFIKELWPAQHLIGKADIYRGKSAVIQMPTSAGKTKSIELIIRSAFISERTKTAVIVAPFRALCHEIKNSLLTAFKDEPIVIDELTDVFQIDFDVEELLEDKRVIVVTPEKLLYVLRHNPEICQEIGLLILDEGHQFDSGKRGVTYELLLTTLRRLLPENTQKVIISAVIGNAETISDWFNGEINIVNGLDLIPTLRSTGFASWTDLTSLGQIRYVSNTNIEEEDFYVPRVIETKQLEKVGNERKTRYFPAINDSKSIALYLGLKLVPNGGVAIFCGTKQSVTSVLRTVIDIYEHGFTINTPINHSEIDEVKKLANLYKLNIGVDSVSTKCANLGVFSHDGNTPHGIRLATEHAMHNRQVCFVVCTSTLSQGVNLPIKYLIVDGLYQGTERIKTKDFHNLIGRAGRAGIYNEGGILFADASIYDRRRVLKDGWKWNIVKDMIDPSIVEPCMSNILSVFDPIKSDDNKIIINIDPLELIKICTEKPNNIDDLINKILEIPGKKFSKGNVVKQLESKMNTVAAIESFLMTNWDGDIFGDNSISIDNLAEGTLAYYLADTSQKLQLKELFRLLSSNIAINVDNADTRKIYGKTLFGLWEAKEIESWVNDNIQSTNYEINNFIEMLWPLLFKYTKNNSVRKCSDEEAMKELLLGWINGNSFFELYKKLSKTRAYIVWGSKQHSYDINQVVDICENGFAYDGVLLLGAIIEFIENPETNLGVDHQYMNFLKKIQKQMKYGLLTTESIILYEMGFSDRVISQQMSSILGSYNSVFDAQLLISISGNEVKELIDSFPSYYRVILSRYL